jgi:hypothetical protein
VAPHPPASPFWTLLPALALVAILGGRDAPLAAFLAAALVPLATALARNRLGRRKHPPKANPLACDIVPDPLSPDWNLVARGIAGALARTLAGNTASAIRLHPCPGHPYAVHFSARGITVQAETSPKRPRPVPTVPLSLRTPTPVRVEETERTLRLTPHPSKAQRLVMEEAVPTRTSALAPALSALSLLFLLRYALDGRLFPALFNDPVRLVFYAFVPPLALRTICRTIRARWKRRTT